MKYIYQITGWKDGSEKRYIETPYKSKADQLAIYWRKEGIFDAIDVCKVTSENGYMHSKTCHTFINGKWEYSYAYIGEDEE